MELLLSIDTIQEQNMRFTAVPHMVPRLETVILSTFVTIPTQQHQAIPIPPAVIQFQPTQHYADNIVDTLSTKLRSSPSRYDPIRTLEELETFV
eukprot:TRINITY_DN10381_c0_g1_i1.p2 TRINITY_DN10381_c0_g1~~TRINITY_DN10381_c0_g1_i1.p2  ORF type:complete len:94 (+),score=0.21 TRINITY_DN10381_c0_g1_i1:69-350(+)